MSIQSFIPEIWSARLAYHLNNELIYANLLNRDYEGDIRQAGDTVVINTIGGVTIKKYDRTKDIDPPEELDTDQMKMAIDQEYYYNFGVKDIDAAQAANGGALVDKATESAAYGLAENADAYCANLLAGGTLTKGLGTDSAPITVDSKNAYEYIVAMRTMLNKGNVPKQGRWIVVPPEFEGMMLLDPRFASADGSQAEGRLVNGLVARAAGIDIYVSNTVPNTDGQAYKVIAGTNAAGSFAEQLLETEAYRVERQFQDAVKGLHVYGGKLVYPDMVAVATVNFEGPEDEDGDGGDDGGDTPSQQAAKSSK